jgi:hypothetical protein
MTALENLVRLILAIAPLASAARDSCGLRTGTNLVNRDDLPHRVEFPCTGFGASICRTSRPTPGRANGLAEAIARRDALADRFRLDTSAHLDFASRATIQPHSTVCCLCTREVAVTIDDSIHLVAKDHRNLVIERRRR